MKLYAAMNRLFRRSYALKLFAVAFVGTHIPLLAGAVVGIGYLLFEKKRGVI